MFNVLSNINIFDIVFHTAMVLYVGCKETLVKMLRLKALEDLLHAVKLLQDYL